MGSSAEKQNQIPSTPVVPSTPVTPNPTPTASTPEIYMISRDLLSLINKYGLPKFSIALNGVLSDIKASENKV